MPGTPAQAACYLIAPAACRRAHTQKNAAAGASCAGGGRVPEANQLA